MLRTLIPILGLALLLRLPGLASKPLWYDEAFAVLFSDEGLKAMVAGTLASEAGVAADIHPLAYYTVLWGWNDVFGSTPAATRSLSVVLGLGIVTLGYLFSRRLFNEKVAWIAGLLLAVSPFQIHYAQEVRMYALLAGLLIAATWAYWEALTSDRPMYWAGVSVLSAGALYSHNLAALYLLPLLITPHLLRRWSTAIKSFLAGLGALVLYMPWLLGVPSQIARVHASYWIDIPGPADLINTIMTYVVGLPVPDWALPLALFLGFLLVIIAALGTIRGVRDKTEESRKALWLVYLAFAPVILMFVVSQILPVYVHRAMLGSGALFTIWIAWSIQTPSLAQLWRRTAIGIVAISTVLGLWGYYTYRGFPYAPFSELAQHLERVVTEEEVVVHSNKLTTLPAVYYSPTLIQRYLSDPSGSGSDTLAPATQQVLGLIADDQIADAAGGRKGVWFVVFEREIDDYRSIGVEHHPSLSWLRRNYRTVELDHWGELQVHHFTDPTDT
jgi:4-amino-4-deoxy-L-arabinose transferase-like glycosyltransferase